MFCIVLLAIFRKELNLGRAPFHLQSLNAGCWEAGPCLQCAGSFACEVNIVFHPSSEVTYRQLLTYDGLAYSFSTL